MKSPLLTAYALAAAIASACVQAAEPYPVRPIRLVVPFPPGGGTDITARVVGQKLAEQLATRVVIDNRPGAGGVVGTEIAAKAAPDGYTLVLVSASHTVNPSLHPRLPYDTVKDLAPITLVAIAPGILVVSNSVPARTVREFVALAQGKPGQFVYGSAGNGTPAHLGMELLKNIAGIDVVHVPYKGSGALITDILSGQIAATIPSLPTVLSLVKTGKLRALAVTTVTRSGAAPDVPTMIEAGVPGYESGSWYGLLTSAGTPQTIIDRLNTETARVLRMNDVRERLLEQGLDPIGGSSREFADRIRVEIPKWARVVKDSGLKLD